MTDQRFFEAFGWRMFLGEYSVAYGNSIRRYSIQVPALTWAEAEEVLAEQFPEGIIVGEIEDVLE